jgi:hypothetical protein
MYICSMKSGLVVFFTLCFSFLIPSHVSLQGFATVKGFVKDKDGLEPLSMSSVGFEGTTTGTLTDNNGFFSITRVKPGTYTFFASVIGYERYTKEIELEANQVINLTILLSSRSKELRDIDISTDRNQERKEDTRVSTVSFTPEQMKRLPNYGGEADIAQVAQLIPGAISTGDQGGQLFIRGGPPIQNKIIMDGATIYSPFHSIGFFSVFDTDILRNFDVYAGGFGAQYGGRISSVMEIKTKDGNRQRLSGRVNVNPFTSKVLLEGPMSKVGETGALVSFLLSAKGSYLAQSSRAFYPHTQKEGLPFNFFDGYGKVTLHSGNGGSKVNLFGFSHNDWVTFNENSELSWTSSGGGANFMYIPTDANVNIEGLFSYTNYSIQLSEAGSAPRFSDVNGFNFGINFHQFYGTSRFTYGIEAHGFSTDFRYRNALNRILQQRQNTTELAAFLRYKFIVGRFVFDPSVRLHYYASMNEVSPEPRLAVKYNVSERFRLKAATGMYSQNFVAANSDRDVVNLFYGFLSGSTNLPTSFKGEVQQSSLQKANHFIFGGEWEVSKIIDFNLEGYFMDFNQLINVNRDKAYDDTPGNFGVSDYLKKDFIRERGWSAGLDFLVKTEYKNWYLWVGYSLMAIRREDELREYTPHFDRTHNVNLVLSYRFGKNDSWEFSGRWNFGSGFPFTQTQGFYEFLNFQGGITTDYTTTNGDLGIQLAEINKGRLPTYHRLDLSIRKTISLGERSSLEVNAGATNAYNRENIFYIDRVTFDRVNQLPIIPTIGLNLKY